MIVFGRYFDRRDNGIVGLLEMVCEKQRSQDDSKFLVKAATRTRSAFTKTGKNREWPVVSE